MDDIVLALEQCLTDLKAIEAEILTKGHVFMSWTSPANTMRWLEDKIIPDAKLLAEDQDKALRDAKIEILRRLDGLVRVKVGEVKAWTQAGTVFAAIDDVTDELIAELEKS